MNESAFHPEDVARSAIDRRLALCGWVVQSRADMNLGAGLGVAIREFQTASGPVDYALFVGRRLCGVIEAKSAGVTLSGFSDQAARYIADLPRNLVREEGQVRFEYVASGSETLFRDHADPNPTSRSVFAFHRPETLERWLGEALTLRGRLGPQAARLLRDGLVMLVLARFPHRYASWFERTAAPAPWQIRRALAFIDAHRDGPLTVQEVADAIGIGLRSLQEGFRKHKQLSPHDYIKQARLARARSELLDPASTRSIEAIARHWGFVNRGHFALDYRNAFGEQPSQTRRRR